jgi:protein SCO1/2
LGGTLIPIKATADFWFEASAAPISSRHMTHFPERKSLRLLAAVAVLTALTLSVLIAGCKRDEGRSGEARQFNVRGIVRGISPDRRTLDVQHEQIPGYMPTMTMPFVLKEPREAAELKIGDGISFRLVVNDKEAVIDRVTKIPAREVEVPALAQENPSESSSPRLREGDEMPAFSLTNQNGEAITRETFRGRPFVVTFIFTRCPIPNFCPLMSRNFAQLQEAMSNGSGKLAETKLLSVSIDPQFDTPQILKEYAASEHADPARWSFATGAPAGVAKLTAAFAVMVQPESGTISHGLATALIDADGRIVEIWRGNGWKPEEVLAKISEVQ